MEQRTNMQARVRPVLRIKSHERSHLMIPGQAAPVWDLSAHVELGRMSYILHGAIVRNGNQVWGSDGTLVPIDHLEWSRKHPYQPSEYDAVTTTGDVGMLRHYTSTKIMTVPGVWPLLSLAPSGRHPYWSGQVTSITHMWKMIHEYGVSNAPFPRPFFAVDIPGQDGDVSVWDVATERVVHLHRLRCPFEALWFEHDGRDVLDLCSFTNAFQDFQDRCGANRLYVGLPGTPCERHAASGDKEGNVAYTVPSGKSCRQQMAFLQGGHPEADHNACLAGNWFVHRYRVHQDDFDPLDDAREPDQPVCKNRNDMDLIVTDGQPPPAKKDPHKEAMSILG